MGQPATKANLRKLKYGGRVDSKGNIVYVVTKKEHDKQKCSRFGQWLFVESWEKKAILIIFVILVVIAQMMALWIIDISLSAMIVNATTGENFTITNGFFVRNPMQGYHIGLWTIIVSTTLLAITFIFFVIRDIVRKIMRNGKHE